MATQPADMPPKTTRLGIFPHSIRKIVIVFMIILFLIGGIIGIIGVWQNWGIVSNVLFMIFAVAGVILGILTFWPSKKSNEASAPASPVPPRQFRFKSIISLTWGQQVATQQVPSSSNESGGQEPIPNTNATNAQQQPSKNMPTGDSPVSPVRRDESPRSYAKPRPNSAGEIRKKLENLGTHKEKHNAVKRDLEEPLPNTLRGCVETAQWNVDQAYDLLNPEMNILPEDIANAAQYLQAAKGDIEHLQKLLLEHSPLPEHGSIIDQVRIIADQIDEYLIPHLKPSETPDKDFQRRFTPLLKALNKLDTLIPN